LGEFREDDFSWYNFDQISFVGKKIFTFQNHKTKKKRKEKKFDSLISIIGCDYINIIYDVALDASIPRGL
jgi:hypothetical protein